MTTRTRRLWCCCVLVCAFAVAACTDMDAVEDAAPLGEPTAQEQAAEPSEWLFSVQADATSTYADGTLVMPASSVMAFTDRPHRDSRVTSLESFASLWDVDGPDSFTDDPPNAVLTYWDGTGPDARPHSVVCEVDGDVSSVDGPSGRALSMGITVLEPKGVQLPATLERAALFVDDLPSDCTPAPEDQEIVEFANMEEFDEGFSVVTQAAPGGGSAVQLLCADMELAPEQFQLVLGDVDDPALQTECNREVPWTLTAAQLQASALCTGGRCTMPITVRNRDTLTVFSQTLIQFVPSTTGQVGITPELDPAMLPFCPDIPHDIPTIDTSSWGTIQLCPGPGPCTPTG
jgi:hypothetical protein